MDLWAAQDLEMLQEHHDSDSLPKDAFLYDFLWLIRETQVRNYSLPFNSVTLNFKYWLQSPKYDKPIPSS